jgi:hypothetical protein
MSTLDILKPAAELIQPVAEVLAPWLATYLVKLFKAATSTLAERPKRTVRSKWRFHFCCELEYDSRPPPGRKKPRPRKSRAAIDS